jgi:hypothetical protein
MSKKLSAEDIELRKKACYGKTKHKSWLAAEYILDRHKNDPHLHIYKCPYCKFLHLGHSKFELNGK